MRKHHEADPTDIPSQQRARDEAAKQAKIEADNESDDCRWLMGDKRGRRLMWRDLESAGVFRPSFNSNALQMAFAEGNRNSGLRKLALIHAVCPEMYVLMMKENTHDKRNHADDGG